MDQLNIAEASVVADIGAGAGWFTIRLAKRVGPNGLVYAQDVQHEMITAIRRRVQRENLQNVRVVQGHENSHNLPSGQTVAAVSATTWPSLATRNTGGLPEPSG